MVLWVIAALLATAVSVRCCFVLHQLGSHVQYLQHEVRSLGGEDRWSTPCSHCGKPIRDSASIRYATKTVTGETWVSRTDGVFHLDRPDCSAAADLEVER